MEQYPEIERLQSLVSEHSITVELLGQAGKSYTHWVKLSVGDKSWKLYVDDEFGDLEHDKPVIGLFLVLSTLLDYSDSEGYLEWCKVSNIESSDKWLDYYRGLSQITRELEQELGSLDPIISQYDYTISTGLAKRLRAL